MELTIAVADRQGERLVEIGGPLDYASAPYLRRIVLGLFDDGAAGVTLDLAGARLVDAAAIRVLLYLHQRGAQVGTELRTANAAGVVLTALEIAGVAKTLAAYDAVTWPGPAADPVDLGSIEVGYGHWPADVTGRLLQLHAMHPTDPARAAARRAVIERSLPAAHRLARRYAGAGEPLADLSQVAALGLVKAVDGFDPDRGIEFPTYATPTIVGELKRHFRDRSSGVRLPRRLQELRMAVNQTRDALTQRLGHAPTTAELAAEVGVPEERIIELMSALRAYRPVSVDTPVAAAPAAGLDTDATILDVLGAEAPEYGLVDARESLRRIIGRLPEREQRILSLRFFGNLSQAQIGEQVGMSQMHVSRLLNHALGFIRRRLSE
ncbi:SigB/SigF/SigG family RNA polymerase sigma factor [Dactylosporangium sp. CA-139066]|uniref:SigB/SigF/SigG family RNA polymerase sigma factor n=1 Tax=Dactylosporangium sp. CA-139066 TaxID=3239930 RepID=UPI003D9035A1